MPRQVAVHGFMTLEGQKISKTTGNLIDPVDLVDEFGADPVRFYILREFCFAQDGDFSRAKLIDRHNADLAQRPREPAEPQCRDEQPVPERDRALGPAEISQATSSCGRSPTRSVRHVDASLRQFDFPTALDAIWLLVQRANTYVEENKPWRLAKDPTTPRSAGDGAGQLGREPARARALPVAVHPHDCRSHQRVSGATSRSRWRLSERGLGVPSGRPCPHARRGDVPEDRTQVGRIREPERVGHA